MNQESLKNSSIWGMLRPYALLIAGLVFLTVLANGLNLAIPKIISSAIDSYGQQAFDLQLVIIEFFIVSLLIFIFVYLQNIMQTSVSEKVAKNLRTDLASKISTQDYNYIQGVTPSRLLTNLTSDVDAVKTFVSQAVTSIISSVFLILGASILLFMINWELALAILAIMPIIGITFAFVFSKVRKLFKANQETIDWLNKIINESILGSTLIRILNSQTYEYQKFLEATTRAKDIGMQILKLFATLMPIIMLTSNLAILVILLLG